MYYEVNYLLYDKYNSYSIRIVHNNLFGLLKAIRKSIEEQHLVNDVMYKNTMRKKWDSIVENVFQQKFPIIIKA